MPPTTQKQIRAVAVEKLERVHGELQDLSNSKNVKGDMREVIRYIDRKVLEAIALLEVRTVKP
jgi:hypothetical protein